MAEISAVPDHSQPRRLRTETWRRLAVEYGFAALAIGLAAALRAAIGSTLGGQAGYMFFVPAVLIGSALGGWKPGIFATVASMLIGVLFIADYGSFSLANNIDLVAFAVVGIGASWRGELLRRALSSAAKNAEIHRCARGPSSIYPRHHSRCHDRHHRARYNSIFQHCS